jgi:hypothetical protein
MPKSIVTDNASTFSNQIMSYLCKSWKIQHKFCSPYHPQSNLTERTNRTLKTMIRTFLDGHSHKNWAKFLPFLQLAINSSKHDSTGFSPGQIFLNKDMNLPFDNSISFTDDELKSLNKSLSVKSDREIIFDRQERYNTMLSLVCSNLDTSKIKQKQNYDKHHRDVRFQIGDLVVIKDTTLSSKDKGISAGLSPLFKAGVATIDKVLSDLNYIIKYADGVTRGPIHIQSLRRYYVRDFIAAPTTPPSPSLSSSQPESTYINSTIPQEHADTIDNDICNDNESNLSHNFDNFDNDDNMYVNDAIAVSESGPSDSASEHGEVSNDVVVTPSGNAEGTDDGSKMSINIVACEGDDSQSIPNLSNSDPTPRKSSRLIQKPSIDYKKLAGFNYKKMPLKK